MKISKNSRTKNFLIVYNNNFLIIELHECFEFFFFCDIIIFKSC